MNRIRELRQEKNLSQEELARLLGVDRSTVAKWEIGTNLPRAEKLITLAKIFGCSVDKLFTSDKNEPSGRERHDGNTEFY